MIVAFAAASNTMESELDTTFGRAKYFIFYNTEDKSFSFYDNIENAEQAHGVGPKAAKVIIEAGAELVIAGNMPGSNAMSIFEHSDIKIFVPSKVDSLINILESYYQLNP